MCIGNHGCAGQRDAYLGQRQRSGVERAEVDCFRIFGGEICFVVSSNINILS